MPSDHLVLCQPDAGDAVCVTQVEGNAILALLAATHTHAHTYAHAHTHLPGLVYLFASE